MGKKSIAVQNVIFGTILPVQSGTACPRFSIGAFGAQLQACARFISPQPYSFPPAQWCARDVADFLELQQDCLLDKVIEIVDQCLKNKYIHSWTKLAGHFFDAA